MALASSALVRVAPAVATRRASRAAPRRGLMIFAGAKGARARAFDPEFEKKSPAGGETRTPPHTHELRVTSTNDLVDAVIRRALRPAEPDRDSSLGAFGDADEYPGTRHADDTEVLDALLSRAGEVTAFEASDVLHAVSRSRVSRSSRVPAGASWTHSRASTARSTSCRRCTGNESAPMAWMRPRREETDGDPAALDTGAPVSRRPAK